MSLNALIPNCYLRASLLTLFSSSYCCDCYYYDYYYRNSLVVAVDDEIVDVVGTGAAVGQLGLKIGGYN